MGFGVGVGTQVPAFHWQSIPWGVLRWLTPIPRAPTASQDAKFSCLKQSAVGSFSGSYSATWSAAFPWVSAEQTNRMP